MKRPCATPACCRPEGSTIRRTDSHLSPRNRLGMLACRLSNRFRMHYRVDPGLYTLGKPGQDDPVFVTANYRYSFDSLRRNLAGIDGWILVLDTAGINVWCAAGKGSFGTKELVQRISAVGLAGIVSHRRLILPQLGAPGIAAHRVQAESGFRVEYGPVLARDLPAWLMSGRQATAAMRRVRFPLAARAVLIPLELLPALRKTLLPLLAAFLLGGLTESGILFVPAWQAVPPILCAAGLSLALGTVLFPLLLPLVPGRAFSLKGLLLGVAGFAGWLALPGIDSGNPFLVALVALALPAHTSYLAFNFTGCTTFTNPSGVKKELRIAWPLYRAALILAIPAFVLYKLYREGIL